jgi:hypothetical protein
MFQVIAWARMTVGAKALGTLSTGYLNALSYARQRVQGTDLTQALDKTARRVTITHHPEVRRSLMLQKAYAEGLRALLLYAAACQDKMAAGQGDADLAGKVSALLLPVIKGAGSERAYEQLAQSLQILGGSGFMQDYPIEQYLRDSKVDSLYEGTTAIQAQDFFFRTIVRDQGRTMGVVTAEIAAFAGADAGRDRALLAQALEDVQDMADVLAGYVAASADYPASLYKAGQHAVRLLMSFGDLLIGWLLQRQAVVALRELRGGPGARDAGFYEGKVAVASFFARTVLPELSARRAVIAAADNALMEISETAF